MSEVVAGDERARLKAEIRNLPRDSETYDEELRAIDDVCIDVEALIIKTERGLLAESLHPEWFYQPCRHCMQPSGLGETHVHVSDCDPRAPSLNPVRAAPKSELAKGFTSVTVFPDSL